MQRGVWCMLRGRGSLTSGGCTTTCCPSPPPPASRVTSGLRKASRAASADKDAASARFPLWSRICTSTLKDHTCCMNLLLSALP